MCNISIILINGYAVNYCNNYCKLLKVLLNIAWLNSPHTLANQGLILHSGIRLYYIIISTTSFLVAIDLVKSCKFTHCKSLKTKKFLYRRNSKVHLTSCWLLEILFKALT